MEPGRVHQVAHRYDCLVAFATSRTCEDVRRLRRAQPWDRDEQEARCGGHRCRTAAARRRRAVAHNSAVHHRVAQNPRSGGPAGCLRTSNVRPNRRSGAVALWNPHHGAPGDYHCSSRRIAGVGQRTRRHAVDRASQVADRGDAPPVGRRSRRCEVRPRVLGRHPGWRSDPGVLGVQDAADGPILRMGGGRTA